MTMIDMLYILSNVVFFWMFWAEKHRNEKFRANVESLVGDDGRVEGEAHIIIDEIVRISKLHNLPTPTPQEFAYALLRQDAFRRAVAHEEIHNAYVEAYGKKS